MPRIKSTPVKRVFPISAAIELAKLEDAVGDELDYASSTSSRNESRSGSSSSGDRGAGAVAPALPMQPSPSTATVDGWYFIDQLPSSERDRIYSGCTYEYPILPLIETAAETSALLGCLTPSTDIFGCKDHFEIERKAFKLLWTSDNYIAFLGEDWIAFSMVTSRAQLAALRSHVIARHLTLKAVYLQLSTLNVEASVQSRCAPAILVYATVPPAYDDETTEMCIDGAAPTLVAIGLRYVESRVDPGILTWILECTTAVQRLNESYDAAIDYKVDCDWLEISSTRREKTIDSRQFLDEMTNVGQLQDPATSDERKVFDRNLATELAASGVATPLREYQLRGVAWLLKRLYPHLAHHMLQKISPLDFPPKGDDNQHHAILREGLASALRYGMSYASPGWVRLASLAVEVLLNFPSSDLVTPVATFPLARLSFYSVQSLQRSRGGLTIEEFNDIIVSGRRALWYDVARKHMAITVPIARQRNGGEDALMGCSSDATPSAILADEMGLGKSLQILSLIALCKKYKLYLIDHCSNVIRNDNRGERGVQVDGCQTNSTAGQSSVNSSSSRRVSRSAARLEELGPSDEFLLSCFCGKYICTDSNRLALLASESLQSKKRKTVGNDHSFAKVSCEWIQCRTCRRGCHRSCAGVGNQTSEIDDCFACQCRKYQAQPLESRCTLLILPGTLVQQWRSEISKHLINNLLDVSIYEGCSTKTLADRGFSYHDICPDVLASKDIVIVGIQTLLSEFALATKADNSCAEGIYSYHPPPIFGITFDMIVFDETQRMEGCGITKLQQLACKISTRRRVCVSGTPIGSDRLTDLRTLAQFLELSPYGGSFRGNTRQLQDGPWNSLFVETQGSHEQTDSLGVEGHQRRKLLKQIPIINTVRREWLSQIFAKATLRRTKAMVIRTGEWAADRANAVGKTVAKIYKVNYLTFTQFEAALYKERRLSAARELNSRLEPSSGRLDTELAARLEKRRDLNLPASCSPRDLLDFLRKGCCHPSFFDQALVGKSNGNHRGPRPFSELMVLKVEQARFRCQEQARSLLFNIFSMAGSDLISAQNTTAVDANDLQNGVHHLHYLKAILSYLYAWHFAKGGRFCQYQDDQSSSPLCLVVALTKFSCYLPVWGSDANVATVNSESGENVDEWEDINRDISLSSADGIPLAWSWNSSHLSIPYARVTPPASFAWARIHNYYNESRGIAISSPPSTTPSHASFTLPTPLETKFFLRQSHRPHAFSISSDQAVASIIKAHVVANSRSANSHGMDIDGVTSLSISALVFPAHFKLSAFVDNGVGSTVQTACFDSESTESGSDASYSICDLLTKSPTSAKHCKKYISPVRSKTFRLQITQIHRHVLLIMTKTQSQQVECYHSWCDISQVSCSTSQKSVLHTLPVDIQNSLPQVLNKPQFDIPIEINLCVKLNLFESQFEMDSFQVLHLCHNFVEAVSSGPIVLHKLIKSALLHTSAGGSSVTTFDDCVSSVMSNFEASERIEQDEQVTTLLAEMTATATQIEQEYLQAARMRHTSARAGLVEAIRKSNEVDEEIRERIIVLQRLMERSSRFNRDWWTLFLDSRTELDGFSIIQSVLSTMTVAEHAYDKFKHFSESSGLCYYLGIWLEETNNARSACLSSTYCSNDHLVGNNSACSIVTAQPTLEELVESSTCRQCRSDKNGPVCSHCKILGVEITTYFKCIHAYRNNRMPMSSSAGSGSAQQLSIFDDEHDEAFRDPFKPTQMHISRVAVGEYEMDSFFVMVMKQFKSRIQRQNDVDAVCIELCLLELKRCEHLKTEVAMLNNLWDRHSELLKVHDELNQCKQRIQVGDFTDIELLENYQESYGNAAHAEIELKDAIGNLNFYRNQERDHRRVRHPGAQSEGMSSAVPGQPIGRNSLNDLSWLPTTTDCSLTVLEGEVLTAAVASNHARPINADSDNDGVDSSCIICRSSFENSTNQDDMLTAAVHQVCMLPCAHVFHKECILSWLRIRKHCVICKRPAQIQDIVVVHGYGLAVHASGMLSTPTKVRTRPETDSGAPSSGISPTRLETDVDLDCEIVTYHYEADDDVATTQPGFVIASETTWVSRQNCNIAQSITNSPRVRGEWGTKIDALITDLLQLMHDPTHAGEKAIVFSAWTEILAILCPALAANRISYAFCTDVKRDFSAINGPMDRFRNQPDDPRVLLMTVHMGAEGLDLVVANHVFLLEPLLNMNTEAQAINRIDRLGQRRICHVYKYVIRDTVEEALLVKQKALSQLSESSDAVSRKMGEKSIEFTYADVQDIIRLK